MKANLILAVILAVLVTGNFGWKCSEKCTCKCICDFECTLLQKNSNITANNGKAIVSETGALNDNGECICECSCCNPNPPSTPPPPPPPGPPHTPKCAECSRIGEYVYYIGNCNLYCVCLKDGCIVKECPLGLYFDHESQRCEKRKCSDCPYK
ncbi:hypothetical protein ACFFRR_007529 [Megaselia abdita]